MLFFFVIPIHSSFSRCLTLCPMRILRIVKHRCADAILTPCSLQDVVIDTAVTAAPEGFVVRQVGEGDRRITQLRIHLHHSRARGQAKYLRLRPAHAGQLKGHVFDALRYTQSAEIRVDDQSGGRDILFVPPRLDIAESRKRRARQGYHGLALLHLCCHILVCALGNASTALLCCYAYSVEYLIDVLLMCGVCHKYSDVVVQSYELLDPPRPSL